MKDGVVIFSTFPLLLGLLPSSLFFFPFFVLLFSSPLSFTFYLQLLLVFHLSFCSAHPQPKNASAFPLPRSAKAYDLSLFLKKKLTCAIEINIQ